MSPVVNVQVPINMTRQRSSNHGLDGIDINSLSSVETLSPPTGSAEGSPSRGADWQIVTAHDNGQVQVWDMTTGVLQPVFRVGSVGASARWVLLQAEPVLLAFTLFASTVKGQQEQQDKLVCDVVLHKSTLTLIAHVRRSLLFHCLALHNLYTPMHPDTCLARVFNG